MNEVNIIIFLFQTNDFSIKIFLVVLTLQSQHDILCEERFERGPHTVENNNKLQIHQDICDQIHTLYCKKNADYGDSAYKTFKDFGIVSVAIRISDKFNRFINLIKHPTIAVVEESIVDTLMDMAGYCILAVMFLKEEEDEGRKDS